MVMNGILEQVAAAAQANIPVDVSDYEQDGLLHCGKCGTPKEKIMAFPEREGIKIRILCRCATEARDKELSERRAQEQRDRMDRMRSIGMWDQKQREATFANADGRNAAGLKACKQYCDHWPEMKKENAGLLMWGGVGAGKSFAAACIANEVMDTWHQEVMMTNFPRVRDGLWSAEDKVAYIDSLVQYPLLILDDFGVERNTEFAMEQIYQVVDARYRSGKPLIITTNLTLEQIEETDPKKIDLMHQRIFSRILEMCIPFKFGGIDRRTERTQDKRTRIRAMMNDKEQERTRT